MKIDEFDYLPDGRLFHFWDCETKFTKTYFVSKDSNASDNNPGTKLSPFATIGQAAKVLQPGERVVIGGGVYHEFVRPERGGTAPDNMISYEALPGEKVILSGAREFKGSWVEPYGWNKMGYKAAEIKGSDPDSKIYTAKFNPSDFETINPFSMVNCASHSYGDCPFWFHYMPKEADWQPFLQRRGLLFADGKLLKQVNYFWQLSHNPGSYLVEDSGLQVFVRMWDDDSPEKHVITYTTREQLFSPANPYTGYVRVKGLEFEYVANGFPGSQKGAISTNCGHHWIIEDNKVRWANAVGIDIGHESPFRYSDEPAGGHIVRNNYVSDCGISGICGNPASSALNESILIEKNILERNCWHDAEFMWESAAIKVHLVRNGLIRFNVIRDNGYGTAIWTDFGNVNERVCANTVINCKSCIFGAIFVEASDKENLVDHNVVYNVRANPLGTQSQRTSGGGHGIYEHDSDYLRVENNIVIGCDGAGVFLNYGAPERICNGHGPIGQGHRVLKNIITDCGRAIVFPSERNFSDGNLFGLFNEGTPFRIERVHEVIERLDIRACRMFHKWEMNGKAGDIWYRYNEEKSTLTLDMLFDGKQISYQFSLNEAVDLTEIFELLEG